MSSDQNSKQQYMSQSRPMPLASRAGTTTQMSNETQRASAMNAIRDNAKSFIKGKKSLFDTYYKNREIFRNLRSELRTKAVNQQVDSSLIPIPVMRSLEDFKEQHVLGKGTFGSVKKATDQKTGLEVAIKEVKLEKDRYGGFASHLLREIGIQRSLMYDHIISIKEVVRAKNNQDPAYNNPLYLVMDYMEFDLLGLMEKMKNKEIKFGMPQVKALMRQFLLGLYYCHSNQIIHRDLKPANLLLSSSGQLRIADFGLARFTAMTDKQVMTEKVVTLWYRAPEILLGSKVYSTSSDIWSAGCIFAEMLSGREAFFKANDEKAMIDKICFNLGLDAIQSWSDVSKMKHYGDYIKPREQNYPKRRDVHKMSYFEKVPHEAIEILLKMLRFDPAKRPTARDLLKEDWLWDTHQQACSPQDIIPDGIMTGHSTLVDEKRRRDQEHYRRHSNQGYQGRGQQYGRGGHGHMQGRKRFRPNTGPGGGQRGGGHQDWGGHGQQGGHYQGGGGYGRHGGYQGGGGGGQNNVSNHQRPKGGHHGYAQRGYRGGGGGMVGTVRWFKGRVAGRVGLTWMAVVAKIQYRKRERGWMQQKSKACLADVLCAWYTHRPRGCDVELPWCCECFCQCDVLEV